MRIGVFDSGIGGEAIAISLRAGFIDAEILRVSDVKHMPYGGRSPADIFRLTATAILPLVEADCDVIVIACNTASATALTQLRLDFPKQLFIGLEPMIKPAARLTRSKVVAVCATPATLASASYKRLKLLHGARLTFVEPDCSEWAGLIEANEMNRDLIDDMAQYCLERNVDVVVLACTHYHWIKDELIAALNGNADVLEPSAAIVSRVRDLLQL